MVSLDVASNCNFNPKGLSGWFAMINLRTAGREVHLRTERKPLPQTFARCSNINDSRQRHYLVKDDVSISKTSWRWSLRSTDFIVTVRYITSHKTNRKIVSLLRSE